MRGKPFSLFKRGKVWYVRYKTADNTFTTAKSTGQTSWNKAENFALDYLHNGQIVLRENVNFEEFSKGFFDWSGSWATDKRVRGMRISERHCIQLEQTLKGLILPAIGKMRLALIDRAVIKNFRNDLFNQKYAGATINHALSIIKIILETAEEQSLIRGIPRIDRAANNTNHKGILTIDEVRKLFTTEWPDFRSYAASLLAASTGLRLGEVLGLVISDYHPNDKFIHCRRSWDQAFRKLNQTTKTGRARNVFIPQTVINALDRLIATNPYPMTDESFIFYADKSSTYPTEPKIITNNFYKAMASIGIAEETRKERNITFHSHRHFLNSLLINANIPLQKIQSITGHLTAEMTQHYYHLDDMQDVQKVQEELFSFRKYLPENWNINPSQNAQNGFI